MKSASATATAFPVSMKGEAFPVSMKGQRVRVQRPYFECSVSSLERRDEDSLTLLKLQSSIKFPPLSVGENLLLEVHGLRCECSVYSLPQTPVKTQERDERVFVAVQDCKVSPCSACPSLELAMPVPRLSDGLKDKTVRFSRPGLQNITETEATVTEIEGCRPSLSIVHLEIRAAPPPFCTGDLLVLESLDGQRQWEADVRSDAQWEAYGWSYVDPKFSDARNENISISVHVRTAEANRGPRLLPQKPMAILVKPVPNSDLTDNGKAAALRKASKATVDETHIAKPKIKIGIHGYGSIGRAIARIALESKDLELVAINDSAIPVDQMNCMFRDRHERGQWLSSDFKMKNKDPNTLMFGDKEVTIFRFKGEDEIPWNKAGAEYIVEACADGFSADYYKTHTSNWPRYTDMRNKIFKNHLSPFAEILCNRFGMVEGLVTACRAPILHIIPQNSNGAKVIGNLLPFWKGNRITMIFQVPAVDAPPIDLAIELAECKEYGVFLNTTEPSSRFCMLMAWCVEMTRQISQVRYCEFKYRA